MYRNIISIVKGGPAPEEQLPVLRQAGWDGVFFPWTGTERDGALAAAVVRQGLALQSVHAPYDGAEKLWTEDGAAETERLIRCIREVASYGCGLVVMHAIVGMQHIAPTERERAYGFENFSAVYEAAREAGVTAEIVQERSSKDTIENILYAFTLFKNDLLSQKRLNVAVVTSPWHLRRAAALARCLLPRTVSVYGYHAGYDAQRLAWARCPELRERAENELRFLQEAIGCGFAEDFEI